MNATEIEAVVYEAYARQLKFPTHWTEEQRDTFIGTYAAPATMAVLDEWDNIVDALTDQGRRQRRDPQAVAAMIEFEQQQLLRDAVALRLYDVPSPDDSFFE